MPRRWKLDLSRLAVAVEAEIKLALGVGVVRRRISVVVVLLHQLVEYAVICELRLWQNKSVARFLKRRFHKLR